MDDLLKEMRADIKEIKQDVKTLTVGQGVDHEILKEHERRSTNLEARVKPLEDGYKIVVAFLGLITILASITEIVHFFKA